MKIEIIVTKKKSVCDGTEVVEVTTQVSDLHKLDNSKQYDLTYYLKEITDKLTSILKDD